MKVIRCWKTNTLTLAQIFFSYLSQLNCHLISMSSHSLQKKEMKVTFSKSMSLFDFLKYFNMLALERIELFTSGTSFTIGKRFLMMIYNWQLILEL